jgi:DNA-binding MarR family transcriptional regulator
MAAVVRVSAISTALVRDAFGGRVDSNLQIATVFAIDRLPGVRPSELARNAGVLLPSMSRVLSSLAAAGLVQAAVDPHDARQRRVSLTENGLARLDRFRIAFTDLARGPDMREIAELTGGKASEGCPMTVDAALSRLADVGREAFASAATVPGRPAPLPSLRVWVLVSLYARAVEPHPASLAEWLCASRPAMSEHLNRLEEEGLLLRLRPEGTRDGRLVELALTPAGASAAASMVRSFTPHARTMGAAFADLVAAAEAAFPRGRPGPPDAVAARPGERARSRRGAH